MRNSIGVLLSIIILCSVSFPSAQPSDSFFDTISLHQAWDVSTGEGVTIAVLDTGIIWEGELSSKNQWVNDVELNGLEGVDDDNNGYIDDVYGLDLIDFDNDPSTASGEPITNLHGTWIANILASSHSESQISLGPDFSLMSLRVLNENGNGALISIAEAVVYAVNNGADIISMSILTDVAIPQSLIDALLFAVESGVIIVAPRYNYGTGMFSNGIEEGIIAVSPDTISSGYLDTSYPPYTIYGPTNQIPTFNEDGTQRLVSGISFTVPLISGTIGLMKSINSDISSHYLPDVLKYSSNELFEDKQGFPALNVDDSVDNWKNFDLIDFDGDGVNSGEELNSGTDPFDAESIPRSLSFTYSPVIISLFSIALIVKKKQFQIVKS